MPTRLFASQLRPSLAFAVIIFATVPTAASASGMRDTLRAGQCDMRQAEPNDSTAAWVLARRAWRAEKPGAWTNDSLRSVLLALGEADQEVRKGSSAESFKDTAYTHRMRTTDSSNSARLHAIFARFGWPGKSMVGVDGSAAAFDIVQHSETIHSEGLALMQAAPAGEIEPANLALVIDRERKHAGRAQVYGSQFDADSHGLLVLWPLEDAAHVEERRARVGLPPLRAYACFVATMYHAAAVLPAEIQTFLKR